MISKLSVGLQSEAVVMHQKLHTTFTGTVHPISTEEAVVHQYLGIKYASVPARFRQAKLHTAYPPVTDATRHGCVSLEGLPLALRSCFADPSARR